MTMVRGEAENVKKAGRRIRRPTAITESLIISLCSSVSVSLSRQVVQAQVQEVIVCGLVIPVLLQQKSFKHLKSTLIRLTYFYQNVDCDLLPVSLGPIIP